MQFAKRPCVHDDELIELFRQTFTASEGFDEGELIATLVEQMLSDTSPQDIHIFAALKTGVLVGACIFTRIRYSDDSRCVFILAPMAIAPTLQRRGAGQALVKYSLETLTSAGVDMVLTYGDPAFYSKTGFVPVTQKDAPAPYALEHPHGWLINNLTDTPFSSLQGSASCVPALRNCAYW
jgi:predicted N-acetyltransferase YhbS